MRLSRALAGLSAAAVLIAMYALHPQPAAALDYPPAPTGDVVDDYNGVKVPDPYRWLEDLTSDPVQQWVAAENKLTFGYLDQIPGRDRLLQRLTDLSNYPRYGLPSQTAGRYFYSKNDGLQNQSVEYWTDSLNGEPQVLLDPNTWSTDATVALAGEDISDDGQLLLYSQSTHGSDWQEWHVKNITTGQAYPDVVKWSKGGGTWDKTASGFYYGRYPEPKAGEEFTVAVNNPMIYYHKLGTEQSADRLVWSLPEHPDWLLGMGLNEERDLGLIYVTPRGSVHSKLYVLDVHDPQAAPQLLIGDDQNEYDVITNDGSRMWFMTTKDAPRGRIVAFDRATPDPAHWTTVVPEPDSSSSLQSASYVGGVLFLNYLKDAHTQVLRYTLDGKALGPVKLPGKGSAGGFGGRKHDTETFYSYTDMVTPTTMFRYDIPTGQSTLYKRYEVKVDPAQYESHEYFYRSFDGTAIPVFVTYKKGLKLDGGNPTILYAYGGFGIPMTPYFSSSTTTWLDMGGVYAIACIRGGGEYGEAWHEAAMKHNRPVAFQDFIAGAQWLIDEGYTSTPRLAIQGGSNGGMLIGAAMTMRPDLFGVALPEVGVMDMLRFNQFGFGSYWEGDYGSPQNPDDFKVLYSYSPYHNLKPGVRYPATLVTTADTDDRVMPGHSFKFTARLQADQPQHGPPVLIRVETGAGHGGGKPLDKQLAEIADVYAFTAYNMGLSIPTW
jgi:prolyl oligopeptidase